MVDTLHYQSRMHSSLYKWGVNLLLVCLLFISAEGGRLIGVPSATLKISVLWPPTGISLAFLLIFGHRVWPGIFLGNFSYNLLHLLLGSESYVIPFVIASIIATGSLIQALISHRIMKKMSSPGYFNNLQDILVFILPAGALACLIASTIGISTLFIFGEIPYKDVLTRWLTFWLGDTFGVYQFTPLIVVLVLYKVPRNLAGFKGEILLMLGTLVLMDYLTNVVNLPLTYLTFPYCLWVTFRLGILGAAMSVVLVSLSTLIPTALGIGPVYEVLTYEPLLFLVCYLVIISVTSLCLAGLLAERHQAWIQLQEYSKNLESKIMTKSKELKEVQSEVFVKEKLASLGLLTAGIGREIKRPLLEIGNFVNASLDCLDVLFVSYHDIKDRLEANQSAACQTNLESLKNCLESINTHKNQVLKAVDIVLDQSAFSMATKVEIKSINLHTLLNNCLNAVAERYETKSGAKVQVTKAYDPSVGMLDAEAEDLTRAFMNLLENTYDILQEIADPKLSIVTTLKGPFVEITLRDNSLGIPQENLHNFFEPFRQEKIGGMGLAIAHDIIVHEHHGEIHVNSAQGRPIEIKILLPRIHLK